MAQHRFVVVAEVEGGHAPFGFGQAGVVAVVGKGSLPTTQTTPSILSSALLVSWRSEGLIAGDTPLGIFNYIAAGSVYKGAVDGVKPISIYKKYVPTPNNPITNINNATRPISLTLINCIQYFLA